MSTSIGYSAGTISPELIDGYESSRQGGSIVHQILGASAPDVTLRPAGLRTGSLRCLFLTESAAAAAEGALSAAEVFTLTSGDVDEIDMSFIVPDGGGVRKSLDRETRDEWWVEFDFQEVSS